MSHLSKCASSIHLEWDRQLWRTFDRFVTGAKSKPGTLVCYTSLPPSLRKCVKSSMEGGGVNYKYLVQIVVLLVFTKVEYYWGRGGSKQGGGVARVRRGGSGPGCWHFSRNAGRRNIKNGASGHATCSDIAALRSTTVSSGWCRQLHTYYIYTDIYERPASF